MKGSRWKSSGPPTNPRKERDEDLHLFHELRRREKERTVNLLQPVSDEFDPNPGNYPLYRIPSAKKGGRHEFFDLEGDKNDYDWLKTPPATPLFPSLEMEANPSLVVPKQIPILQPITYSRFSGNSQASNGNNQSKTPNPKPSESSRPVTPTTKPIISAPKSPNLKAISSPNQGTNRPTSNSIKRSNFPATTTSPKEPTTKITDHNPKKTNKPNVSDSKPKSRGVSPLVRSRIPATMPGFSDETPQNLRTSASDRPSSVTRGRPGNLTITTDVKPESGKPRRQSCSPSMTRGRRPEFRQEAGKGKVEGGNGNGNGNMFTGSRMVEKVMNARKFGGGEEKETNGKFGGLGNESSGFGRMMSKSSLDMALKHMEIQRKSSNFNHYDTPSTRNSTTLKNNGSLNFSPRATQEQEVGNFESVKKLENRNFITKGGGKNRWGLC
ncbi:uncharacterized protein LOC143846884 [Tasmannia lanceolata]|uniref:uncharacterized protein LOC143846884 n=1 Tax=Tasmannia lanceolata TaxID=3420 RepID=UPI004064B626